MVELGTEPKPFLHVSGMFGVERGCIAIVYPLGWHPTNKNELIVWDLAFDPAEMVGLGSDELRVRMFTRATELPEGVSRLPIKTIHINKSPVVIGNLNTLTPAMAERWQIDKDQALRYAAAFAEAPKPDWKAVFARPAASRVDVDEDLYGGFVGNNDRRELDRLRGMDGPTLASTRSSFDDGRLEELVFRYRARNFADTLSAEEQARWQQLRVARLIEGQGGYRTLETLAESIDTLSEIADDRAAGILEALYDYAETVAPEW